MTRGGQKASVLAPIGRAITPNSSKASLSTGACRLGARPRARSPCRPCFEHVVTVHQSFQPLAQSFLDAAGALEQPLFLNYVQVGQSGRRRRGMAAIGIAVAEHDVGAFLEGRPDGRPYEHAPQRQVTGSDAFGEGDQSGRTSKWVAPHHAPKRPKPQMTSSRTRYAPNGHNAGASRPDSRALAGTRRRRPRPVR